MTTDKTLVQMAEESQQAVALGAEFWNEWEQEQEASFVPFLSEEDKHFLVESGAIFRVDEVQYDLNEKFKAPKWNLRIFMDGVESILSLPENPRRDDWMNKAAQALENKAIIFARMIAIESDKGSDAYILVNPARARRSLRDRLAAQFSE